MKHLKLEKKTTLDGTLVKERTETQEKIASLNEMLMTMAKPPMSVLTTISNLEEKLQELDQAISKQTDMVISENSVDFNLLSEVKDPLELNMLLKRVIKSIVVSNLEKSWRIKVLYLNGHSQSFRWDGKNITFKSDTKKLLEFMNSIEEKE